jgi:hypothetical protein
MTLQSVHAGAVSAERDARRHPDRHSVSNASIASFRVLELHHHPPLVHTPFTIEVRQVHAEDVGTPDDERVPPTCRRIHAFSFP